MNSLTIAIDYDDTFTADPKLWSTLIRNAKDVGHKVMVVTARSETTENIDEINAWLDHWDCQMPVIFTSLASKLWAVEKRGINVDIWIDDNPTALVNGH